MAYGRTALVGGVNVDSGLWEVFNVRPDTPKLPIGSIKPGTVRLIVLRAVGNVLNYGYCRS